MPYLVHNGKIADDSVPVAGADCRGLRFGDGVFETLKFQHGKLILAEEHLARLWHGLDLLKFDVPALLTRERILQETMRLLDKNRKLHARVRWTFFRGDGGLYDPVNRQPQYLIQTWDLPGTTAALNSNGLRICLYEEARKSCDRFSNLKHNNFLPYFMGALYAREQHCNDALILNQYDRLCDSTIANLFLIRKQTIITPALSEGCVAGIMRSFLISELRKAGFQVEEIPIQPDELLHAEEAFLSNSIYNMKWISHYGNKVFGNRTCHDIYRVMQQTNPDVFC